MSAGKAVTAVFGNVNPEKHKEIHLNHQYSIMGTEDTGGFSFVVLRNPHGGFYYYYDTAARYLTTHPEKFRKRLKESGLDLANWFDDQAQAEKFRNLTRSGIIVMELNDFMRRDPWLDYQGNE